MARAPYLRLVPPRAKPSPTGPIDAFARCDSLADHKAGDEHLYQLMEELFAQGHLTAAAWERYALVYERERLSLEKQDGSAATGAQR